jgi:serine O-acetyltransferase
MCQALNDLGSDYCARDLPKLDAEQFEALIDDADAHAAEQDDDAADQR